MIKTQHLVDRLEEDLRKMEQARDELESDRARKLLDEAIEILRGNKPSNPATHRLPRHDDSVLRGLAKYLRDRSQLNPIAEGKLHGVGLGECDDYYDRLQRAKKHLVVHGSLFPVD